MNRITKIGLSSVLLIILALFGRYAYQEYQDNRLAEQEYEVHMEKVTWMMSNSAHSWALNFDLPENPKRVQWDAEYDMPRALFFARHHKTDNGRALWSMNLNGTDVRLVISKDQMSGMGLMMGEEKVSPNGRFIFVNGSTSLSGDGCYLYDIKEQKEKYIGHEYCNAVWKKDGTAILRSDFVALFNPESGKIEPIHLKQGYGEYDGINTGIELFLSRDGSKVIRASNSSANIYYDNENPFTTDKGDYIIFDANTGGFLEKSDYFPKGCGFNLYYSVGGEYFTCDGNSVRITEKDGSGHNEHNLYSATPPFKQVGLSKKQNIIQRGALTTDGVSHIYMNRDADAFSPIKYVSYSYNYNYADNSSYSPNRLYFYLSPNLRDNYSQRDFTSFLPLPSNDEVEEAKRRLQEGQ
ncbi:Putative uncharacterized protein [Moritella viscosa]|uniref:hypothetical protein n=1 Tax=Moritella viscosa TaxID=80854 RepID=UPI0009147D2B|nr:hypothetical protein [Moritella viscosa]SHO21327.1 Putative uncharacterized protein [Moritella viscosa]